MPTVMVASTERPKQDGFHILPVQEDWRGDGHDDAKHQQDQNQHRLAEARDGLDRRGTARRSVLRLRPVIFMSWATSSVSSHYVPLRGARRVV